MQVARHASISRTKTGISPGRPIGRRRLRTAIALAALLTLIVAGTTQASSIYEQFDYSDQGTDTDVCGRYVVDWHNGGHVVIRKATAATSYQFFYTTDTYRGGTVVRNPANGKSFTERWWGTNREQNARRQTQYPGYVFAYETADTAQYEVRDHHGRVVYRDRGTVTTSFVYDTLGDSRPGGLLLEDPVEIKNTWNPDFDFCKLADGLIG
jgi:hypothetical protein